MHLPGSVSIRSSWPSFGDVKGWCTAAQRSFSSSCSNMGKSTTHSGAQRFSKRPLFLPNSLWPIFSRSARDLCAAGHAQGHNAAALGGGWSREDLEVHVLHHFGQLGEFELHAQVGLVGAKAESRFLVSHDGEFAQVHAQLLLEHLGDHALEDRTDFFFAQERGLAVD